MHSATSETDVPVQSQGFSMERRAQKGGCGYSWAFSIEESDYILQW